MSKSYELFHRICTNLIKECGSAFSVSFHGYSIKHDGTNPFAPITLRSSKEIVLNCDLSCEGSIAFQLSHELCHAAIREDVPSNLRWLEETFAVLASYVFPRMLPFIDPCRYGKFFCSSLKSETRYFSLSSNPVNLQDLHNLESGSGTSNFNDYGNYYEISKFLLPIAREYPKFWGIVPYLHQIPAGLSLSLSLDALAELVPSDVSYIVNVIKASSLVP